MSLKEQILGEKRRLLEQGIAGIYLEMQLFREWHTKYKNSQPEIPFSYDKVRSFLDRIERQVQLLYQINKKGYLKFSALNRFFSKEHRMKTGQPMPGWPVEKSEAFEATKKMLQKLDNTYLDWLFTIHVAFISSAFLTAAAALWFDMAIVFLIAVSALVAALLVMQLFTYQENGFLWKSLHHELDSIFTEDEIKSQLSDYYTMKEQFSIRGLEVPLEKKYPSMMKID